MHWYQREKIIKFHDSLKGRPTYQGIENECWEEGKVENKSVKKQTEQTYMGSGEASRTTFYHTTVILDILHNPYIWTT